MLISIALILCIGMFFGWICKKIHFPSLFGMILAGILIGPHALDWIDGNLLAISADIRKIALIIILIRAGLKLSLSDLKKVGRPAILMCFVPATFEVAGMVLLAPKLLGISLLEAALLGAVIGAVSPAVIVPRMIRLIDEGYGKKQAIPQMILAGASVDDVYVLVLFTTFTSLLQGEQVSVRSFINIPVSIVTGIVMGLVTGFVLAWIFSHTKMNTMVKALILLSISFGFTFLEDKLAYLIPFASLIAVMAVGSMLRRKNEALAVTLSGTFDKLWIPAEIFLFVLVGASVAIESLQSAGLNSILLIFAVLVFRMLGVLVCLLGTKLKAKEIIFCMLAYTPKATVQAAIGGLPLAMGFACGDTILTVSVIAILITAPLGAFAIDLSYKRCLTLDKYRILPAKKEDAEEIYALYKMQLGREFCPWNEDYPTDEEIAFDLSRDSIFVMKNEDNAIIASISIDQDESVDSLDLWSKELLPGGELARLAVHVDYQNEGLAKQMIIYGLEELRKRKFKSVHFLVNKENQKALRSYAYFGFEKKGECFLYEQEYFAFEKKI